MNCVAVIVRLKVNSYKSGPEWEHGCALICANDDKLAQSAWQGNDIILLQTPGIYGNNLCTCGEDKSTQTGGIFMHLNAFKCEMLLRRAAMVV